MVCMDTPPKNALDVHMQALVLLVSRLSIIHEGGEWNHNVRKSDHV